MDIILASKSQRRIELLKKINLKFKSIDSKLDELSIQKKHDNPKIYCSKLAFKKAKIVSSKSKESLVIGADTIVYNNRRILEKPINKKEAIEHLKSLSNNTHKVYTAVHILNKSKNINKSFIEETKVTFYNLEKKEINYYIDCYKPYDKAGSYGIQDWSSIFVKKIEGCFYNVVGFPLPKFYKLFTKILKNKSNLHG